MKTKSIGIIDSGLGGYTIFKALRDEYPEVSFTLLADQKNNPFGSKSVEQLELIGSRMVDQLLERNIEVLSLVTMRMRIIWKRILRLFL